jgi:tetratricopeptide (TPR) repeat protein
LGEEKKALVARNTKNLEAYNLYLQGLHFWNKRTAEDIKKAIDSFEGATELDPDYALAYAALADSYGLLPFYTYIHPDDAFKKAKTAALRALEMNENLGEAHSALGFIKMYYEWDWETAEKEFKRAIQINPNHVTAHHWYAEYLSWVGRHEEAIEEIQEALEIDPLSLTINYIKGFVLFYAHKYDEAIEQCQKTLELDKNYLVAYRTLIRAYLFSGKYEEALEAIQTIGNLSHVEFAFAMAGKRNESIRILEDMKAQWNRKEMYAIPIAGVYASLGEEDLALNWLEKALERREPNIVKINVNPIFDSLRSRPRFQALLNKMNLE